MTRERYEELKTAGPALTPQDYERLRKFVPKLSPMTIAVRWAFLPPRATRGS